MQTRLICEEEAESIRVSHQYVHHFKMRSPNMHGVGTDYNSALEDIHKKIDRIAKSGNYQVARLDSVFEIQLGALTYLYPNVTFYRIEP